MVRRIALIIVLLMALAGCERPPSSEVLKEDVSARLVASFAQSFEIVELRRRGTANDITAPAEEARRIVYFDLMIRAREDVNLGSWDTPGAASLVSMLGAGPKGISGVKSDGNKAGDIIRAHGSMFYRKEGDLWQSVAPAGFLPPKAPVTDNQAPRPASESLIAALQATIRSVPPGTAPGSNTIIEEELRHAVTNIQARLTHLQEGVAIAAGPEQGQYLRLVRALTTVDTERRVRVTSLVTAGSIENLTLLREGRALFALSQGDVAALAFAGAGPFSAQGPATNLRALGSLYLEPLHIIVGRDSPIRTASDLAGRRINVGPTGSGSRVTALNVLAAHGVPASRIREAGDLTIAPALAALRSGRIDAVIEVIGLPANEIRTAFAALPLRLVPLDHFVVERLVRDNRGYTATLIPPGAYPRLETSVPTVGVAAILVTTGELTSAEAAAATRLIYTAPDLVKNGSPQGAQVSWRRARNGLTIPLHDGAERALTELGAR
jgi:TRAP transporter TAXI family solute receptor